MLTAFVHPLRARAREALEQAGVGFDEAEYSRYLRQRFALARPLAHTVGTRLAVFGTPTTTEERSLVDAIETMTAFASSVVDCAYAVASRSTTHRDEARRALAEYVIASAIFDHACDEDPALLRVVETRLDEEQLKHAVQVGQIAIPEDAPLLARYFFGLVHDFLQRVTTLAVSRGRSNPGPLRAHVTEVLLGAYRSQLASVQADGGPTRTEVWQTPLLVAYALMQVSGDAADTTDDKLADLARAVGEVLALVDDVADIEEDWNSSSRNRLLDPIRGRRDATPSLLSEVLGGERTEPYFSQLRERARSFAREPWAREVSAWLYYWLYS